MSFNHLIGVVPKGFDFRKQKAKTNRFGTAPKRDLAVSLKSKV
jgi:hypothetical protein